MKFYLTGIQHMNTGGSYSEIGLPLLTYDNVDDYKAKYNQEWSYAYANQDCVGLTVIVFDSTGVIVFEDHWMRTINGQPFPIPPVEGTE